MVGGEGNRTQISVVSAVLAVSLFAAGGPSLVAAASLGSSTRPASAAIQGGHPGIGDKGCRPGDAGDSGCPTAKEGNDAEEQFADILVYKVIDLDGDPDTFADAQDVGGWEFSLEIVGGQIWHEEPVTQEGGGAALFVVSLDQSPASVLVSEELDGSYELLFAGCLVQGPPEFVDVGDLEGAGIRFDVEAGQEIICTFMNAPTEPAAPTPPAVPDTALGNLDTEDQRGTSRALLVLLVVAVIAGLGMLLRPHATRGA